MVTVPNSYFMGLPEVLDFTSRFGGLDQAQIIEPWNCSQTLESRIAYLPIIRPMSRLDALIPKSYLSNDSQSPSSSCEGLMRWMIISNDDGVAANVFEDGTAGGTLPQPPEYHMNQPSIALYGNFTDVMTWSGNNLVSSNGWMEATPSSSFIRLTPTNVDGDGEYLHCTGNVSPSIFGAAIEGSSTPSLLVGIDHNFTNSSMENHILLVMRPMVKEISPLRLVFQSPCPLDFHLAQSLTDVYTRDVSGTGIDDECSDPSLQSGCSYRWISLAPTTSPFGLWRQGAVNDTHEAFLQTFPGGDACAPWGMYPTSVMWMYLRQSIPATLDVVPVNRTTSVPVLSDVNLEDRGTQFIAVVGIVSGILLVFFPLLML